MKKIIALTLIFSSFSTLMFAQKSGKKNVVKINPFGLFFGNASLSYERALNDKNSVVISPTFGDLKVDNYKYSSFGLGAEYRFYTREEAPEGFYLSPGVGFSSGKVKLENSTSNNEANSTGIYIKGVLGKQWIWDSGFTLDLNGGIQYANYKYTGNANSAFNDLRGSGIFPTLSFSLGYNF